MSDSIELKCKSCSTKLVPKFAISELRTASVLPVCPYCIRGRRKTEPREAQNEESSLTSRVRELEARLHSFTDIEKRELILLTTVDHLRAENRRLEEEDKQWDKHSLVEIVKERDALREELKRRYERDRWWDNHSRTEIFIERDKYMEENRRLREALEIIARTSFSQAAKKEGE